MNHFLKFALIGSSITAVIHILLFFVVNVAPEFMFTFYIVWGVFGIIGLVNPKPATSKTK